MKLAPVIARLTGLASEAASRGGAGVKTVDGVKALAELATVQVALPGLFVVPAAEDFRPVQEGAGLIHLETTHQFDVVVLINASATRGRDQDELMTLADAVQAQLFGWSPAPEFRPIVPLASRLLGIDGGRASWIMRFRTVSHLRKIG